MAAPVAQESVTLAGGRGSKGTSSDSCEADSPLLRLPAELRIRIYQFAVVKDKPIEIGYGSRMLGYQEIAPDARPPGLAHVSRQLRHEVLPIFYSENVFNLIMVKCLNPHAEKMAKAWLAGISEQDQRSLESVLICYDPQHNVWRGCQNDCRRKLISWVDGKEIDGRIYYSKLEYPGALSRFRRAFKGWSLEFDAVVECDHNERKQKGQNRSDLRHHLLVKMA